MTKKRCAIVSTRQTPYGPAQQAVQGWLTVEGDRFTIYDLDETNRLVQGMTAAFAKAEMARGRLVLL